MFNYNSQSDLSRELAVDVNVSAQLLTVHLHGVRGNRKLPHSI